ncbi:unnamed protein product, partial [Closterium sp. Naga37s-1]
MTPRVSVETSSIKICPPPPNLSPRPPFPPLRPLFPPLHPPTHFPHLLLPLSLSIPPLYHLYVSYACPWASRCLMALKLKGLDDAISVTVLNPTWVRTREGEEPFGWAFPSAEGDAEEPGAQPDPIFGARFVRDIYEKIDPSYKTFSVPILFDKKSGTIVNNESAEIMRMLNSEFNAVAANPHVDLYPAAMRGAIDGVNEWVGPAINSGVFKCGFAKEQAAYDAAVATLFSALDRCEDILSKQRYLAGDAVTEADIRLFVDLIRFDE